MLTRLKVNGFKNLVDVDVSFGPFTCIVGANGVGKSNLFDAILFLSALADRPFLEAAKNVRDDLGKSGDMRSLFHHVGKHYAPEMKFEVEMIIPAQGADDLSQIVKASVTFLTYQIVLGYRNQDDRYSPGSLELLHEELTFLQRGDARKHLAFPHQKKWRDSVIQGRRSVPLISTIQEDDNPRVILLHQDGSGGKPMRRQASSLPRTILSSTNGAESPTALLARREMQSWRLLQLEPSALRKPDEFAAPSRLGADGSHLPATLYRLSRSQSKPITNGHSSISTESDACTLVANRLHELIRDVREIRVDRDEKRELLTLQLTDRDGTIHPARGLSDGTLRFLALAVLELDSEAQGVLCLEEPENGIHPARIKAMIDLLEAIACDPNEPVGPDNPLRQVIVNTHSPAVLNVVADSDILVAESRDATLSDDSNFGPIHYSKVSFGCLTDTWRSKLPETPPEVSKGKLIDYLNPPTHRVLGVDYSPLEIRRTVNPPRRTIRQRDDYRSLFEDVEE